MSQIILGIPGPWQDRRDIIQRIASDSGGYLLAGSILRDIGNTVTVTADIDTHNPQMRNAFEIAGRGAFSEETLQTIADHKFTIYVLSSKSSVADARNMLRVGVGILRAGGFAIKVESSGIAHTAELWQEIADSEATIDLYEAFVTLLQERNRLTSCGMHNFALPDCSAAMTIPLTELADLIHTFNLYQLAENPTLQEGETFSIRPDSPFYRLTKLPDNRYPADDPFHNPDGLWHLEPLKTT